MGLGANSFMGIAFEPTWGTAVTPTTDFIELVEGGDRLGNDDPLSIGSGINEISIHKTRKVRQGGIIASGDIELEFPYQGIEKLFLFGFGKQVDAIVVASAAYSHIFSIGDIPSGGLTMEAMRDGPIGSESFFYAGGMIDTLEWSLEEGGFWRVVAGIVAKDTSTGAKSTASFTVVPLASFYDDGTGAGVTWNAVAATVTNFRCRLENRLRRDRRFLGSRLIKRPVRGGPIQVTSSFRAEFESLAMFNDFRAATSRVLEIKSLGDIISGATRYELDLKFPVSVLTKATPKVTDRGIVYADIEAQGFWDGTSRELELKVVNKWRPPGLEWTNLGQQAAQESIQSLASLGGGIVLAGTGINGKILRSTDSGATWTDLGTMFTSTTIFSLASLGGGIALAGTDAGGKILRSTDSGATWTNLGTQFAQASIQSLVSLGGGIALAGTDPGGKILRSTDSGATWTDLGTQFAQGTIYSLASLGGGIVLAGTSAGGKILRSTDSGATWTDLGQQAAQATIWSLVSLGGGVALAGSGSGGKILRSTDSGATWTDLGQQGAQIYIFSLASLGGGIALAGGGEEAKILRSTDSGATWTERARQGSETRIRSLASLGGGIVLAGTTGTGLILRAT